MDGLHLGTSDLATRRLPKSRPQSSHLESWRKGCLALDAAIDAEHALEQTIWEIVPMPADPTREQQHDVQARRDRLRHLLGAERIEAKSFAMQREVDRRLDLLLRAPAADAGEAATKAELLGVRLSERGELDERELRRVRDVMADLVRLAGRSSDSYERPS